MFEIINGSRVVVDPEQEVSAAALQPYLLGPVLGAVLHQRDYLVLHASSISIYDAAVAFLGPSGAGKSSIAAAAISRGHDLLCDDIAAVDFRDGTPVILPGFPLLKLTPKLANLFGIGHECVGSASGKKELYRVSSGVPASPQPLKRIYLLADDELQIAELSPSESVQALVGHTYTQSLLDDVSIKFHFRQCTSVAESADINRLFLPKDLDSLLDAVQQIEEEVSE